LDDQLDAAVIPILVAQKFQGWIENALPHWLQEYLATRQDYAAGFLRERPIRSRIV
jgi:hypothetical protein